MAGPKDHSTFRTELVKASNAQSLQILDSCMHLSEIVTVPACVYVVHVCVRACVCMCVCVSGLFYGLLGGR